MPLVVDLKPYLADAGRYHAGLLSRRFSGGVRDGDGVQPIAPR
jgi:hypothetical protein